MKASAKLLLVGFIALSGCVVLRPPETPDRVPLTEENASILDGRYAYQASTVLQCEERGHCPTCFLPLTHENVLGGLARRTGYGGAHPDSATVVSLQLRDPGHLVVRSYRGEVPAEEWLVPGEVDQTGYFVVSRKTILSGLFPLGWGIGQVAAQVGVDHEGNLIVDSGRNHTGFIFGLVPVGKGLRCQRYVYQRLSE